MSYIEQIDNLIEYTIIPALEEDIEKRDKEKAVTYLKERIKEL